EIQEDRIVFGADRMKGKVPHEIALLPMISSALPKRPDNAAGAVFGKRGNGFSGWSKSKSALDAKLKTLGTELPAWGLHDFRRTVSTALHDDGGEPLI